MNLREIFYQRKFLNEVKHTTLDPYGEKVVRIHLIPPKVGKLSSPSVVVLNGKDYILLNPSWAILLSIFIDEVNKYDGKEITVDELRCVKKNTLDIAKKIYYKTDRRILKKDLTVIISVICDIAYGNEPQVNIPHMTIGEYAPVMNSPHRMDLMVSSMSKSGKWHCNQKCMNCYAAGQHNAEVDELSTQEWKSIIDKCKEARISQLTFTGGEPTLRNDLVELIDYSRWFITRLNTNGILLSEKLCKELYKVSLDSVQITLYSSNKNVHEILTGSCGFEKKIQGIKNALAAGLNVSVNTPLCKINKDYVETLKFLHKLGVKYFSCSGIIFTGNARNDDAKKEQLSEDELFSVLKDAVCYCKENDMDISFTSPGLIKEEKLQSIGVDIPTCGACMSNMAIAPNGDVVPCQSWLDVNSSLGNMLTEPWSKIWNAPLSLKIREIAILNSKIEDVSAKNEHSCPLRNGF